jgi:hypothetical protein
MGGLILSCALWARLPVGRSGASAHRRLFGCLKICSEQTTRGLAVSTAGARVASGVSKTEQERQNSVCVHPDYCTSNTHIVSTSSSRKKEKYRYEQEGRKKGRQEKMQRRGTEE